MVAFWPAVRDGDGKRCCCPGGDGGPDIRDERCPIPELPATLFLTFSRQLPGLYEDATLVHGPAPAGWEVHASAFPSPRPFLPNGSEMWWSLETYSLTYFTTPGLFTTATVNTKYAFDCYNNGTTYIQAVWRFAEASSNLGSVEVAISKQSSPPGPVTPSAGTLLTSPFSHAVTLTHSLWIHADLDERPRHWDGSTPARLLVSPIDYLLSE